MHRVEEANRPVVGDDGAVEPPLPPQQVREQPPIRRRRNTVEVGIGVHDRSRSSQTDCHLEGDEVDVMELAETDRDRCVVASCTGRGMAGEVLQRGDHAAALEPAHVRRGEGAREVRILAHGLLDAAPTVVAHDVEHRGEPHMGADRSHVPSDPRRHLADELRIEGRAPGDRGRIGGGSVRHHSGEALLVHEGRDPLRRPCDDGRLQPAEVLHALLGPERRTPVGPSEMTQPLLHRRLERIAPCIEARLHGGEPLGVPDIGPLPVAPELRDLLFEAQVLEEGVDALVDASARVSPHRRGHDAPSR